MTRGLMSPTDPKAPLRGAILDTPVTGDLDTLDRAIRLYRELGFSVERAALTLARNGYPSEAIVARFPTVPAPLIRSNSKSRERPMTDRAGQSSATPAARALLDRLLTRSNVTLRKTESRATARHSSSYFHW